MKKSEPSLINLRQSWKFIVAEMLAIVFGVFLGVWVSGLAEDREVDRFVANSREVMLQELSDNYERIAKTRQYHLSLLPDVVAGRKALVAGEAVPQIAYRGLGAPLVTTAAYDTALSAGTFARVDPAEATRIANAYQQIANMRSVMEDYRLAVATSDREFLSLISTAFGDSLYAEDAAMTAIANVTGQDVPASWTTLTDVSPY